MVSVGIVCELPIKLCMLGQLLSMEGEYEPDIRNQDRVFRDMVPLKHIVRERHMWQTKGSYGVPPQDLLHKRVDIR